MKTILKTDGLCSGYAGTMVLRNVDIEVKQKEIVALVGRNGMGKTTLMKSLIGLLPLQKGMIHYQGRDITSWGPHSRARFGIGYIPQGREVFAGLSVEENIRMGDRVSHQKHNRKTSYELVFEMFPVLKEKRNQKAGTLSGGQQQMLVIARALIGDPDLILLDEPSEGIQPSVIQQIEHHIMKLRENTDVTIFLVEQNCQIIKNVTDRCYVLDQGTIKNEYTREQYQHSMMLEECLAL